MNKNKIRKKLAYKLMFLLIQVRCLLTSMMQILYLKVEVLKSEHRTASQPESLCLNVSSLWEVGLPDRLPVPLTELSPIISPGSKLP